MYRSCPHGLKKTECLTCMSAEIAAGRYVIQSRERTIAEKENSHGFTRELYRHKKSGGVYSIVCRAKLESDGTPIVVYRNVGTDDIWVRPEREFFDGRFVRYVRDEL